MESDLELSSLIESIVDYLQPALSPYESVIYWFVFRHSIIATGRPLARVSVSKISKGIGSKFKSGDSPMRASDKTIGDNLRALENKGIIKKMG